MDIVYPVIILYSMSHDIFENRIYLKIKLHWQWQYGYKIHIFGFEELYCFKVLHYNYKIYSVILNIYETKKSYNIDVLNCIAFLVTVSWRQIVLSTCYYPNTKALF